MKFEIREAHSKDAAKIGAVHLKSWHAAYTGIVSQSWLDSHDLDERARRWEDIISETHHKNRKIYVTSDQGEIRGFCAVGHSRDEAYQNHAELWCIYLHPDYFGKGMGHQLLSFCKNHAVESGFSEMFVNVLAENPLGRNFYERTGAVLMPGSEGKVKLGSEEYDEVKYEWKDLEL